MQHQLDLYRRDDGKWSWQLHAATGRVIAVDGTDGFDDMASAALTARDVLSGDLEVVVEEDFANHGTPS